MALLAAACSSAGPPADPNVLFAAAPVPADRAIAVLGGRPVAADGPALLAGEAFPEEREARVAEELLVREAERRGLLARDPAARRLLAAAAERRLAEAARRTPISEADLRERYEKAAPSDPERDRATVALRFFRSAPGAEARARAADAADPGDAPVVPPPSGPVTLQDLRTAWGPAAAEALARLSAGETSPPVAVPGGFAVLRLIARAPGPAAPFERVRGTIEEAVRREAMERLRAAVLGRLRAGTTVAILDGPADALGAGTPSEVAEAYAEGERGAADPGPAVARVGEIEIRRGELEDELARTYRADGGRFASAKEREAALARLVEGALLARVALGTGLGRLEPALRARAVALVLAEEFGVPPEEALALDPPRLAHLRERLDAWRALEGRAESADTRR